MHSTFNTLIASAHERDLARAARAGRLALRPGREPATERVVLRRARKADNAAVARVAELDSSRVPASPVVLAEVDGEVVAATSLEERRTVADPFRPTEDVAKLLEHHAELLRKAA